MFKAELKAETLKGLVNIVSTLVDEVKVTIHPDSIGIKAIDPSHIAMIDVSVAKEAFVSYEADESELGLDLDKIKSVLKLAGPGDIIAMEHDVDQGRLTVTIGNLVRRMALIDSGGLSDPKVPNVELLFNAKLSIDQLQKGIRAAESITDADHIDIRMDSSGFELLCAGDTDLASLKVPASDLEEFTADYEARSQYPIDYFSNIIKAIPSGSVNILLDVNLPLKLLFDLADGHAHVTYLLAPRIESE